MLGLVPHAVRPLATRAGLKMAGSASGLLFSAGKCNTESCKQHYLYYCRTIIPAAGRNSPLRTTVPLWGQIIQILSILYPKRDCSPKGVKAIPAVRRCTWYDYNKIKFKHVARPASVTLCCVRPCVRAFIDPKTKCNM